jgi:biopolymer transport protein ExbD
MKRFDQINVIPFIDIMLVLLAIVLTTATFISQGAIEINLPEAESAQTLQQPDEKTIEIAINTNHKVFLDGEAISDQELATKLETLDKETPILLRVDKSVAFEHFVGVIDLLKKNSLEKLTIITKEGS